MNVLENWIQQFIAKSPNLEDVSDVEEYFRQQLGALPLSENEGSAVQANRVYHEVLRQFHLAIRGHKHEAEIWSAVLWYLSHPLPINMAHDLIDRGVAVIMMCHTRQADEVQWRLATINEDALYTLVRERYVERRFSPQQFAVMLEIYAPRDDGLLAMLLSFRTQSHEKEALFVAAIERELERFDEMKSKHYQRSGAIYFKQQLATRPDIIERLSKRHRKSI